MEAKIINPFLTAAVEVFETMFRLTAKNSAPYVMGSEVGHRWEISGILGVTGWYKGLVAVRLPRVLADKMLERSGVISETEEERQDLLYSLISELVNTISGNASGLITESMDISPPLVVYGDNHAISWPRSIPVIAIPFTTELGPFEVSVCFKAQNMF